MNLPNDIAKRKEDHVYVCTQDVYNVETSSTYLSKIHLLHQALPNIAVQNISTEISFLQHTLSSPLFILPMSGGGKKTKALNKELIQAAQEANIAVGTGSMRILLEDSTYFQDFYFRKQAPDTVLIANLGVTQLRQHNIEKIGEMLRRLEVDALSIHLNCLQEYFQEFGDRDFTGALLAIQELVEADIVPIIIKETGFGIHKKDVIKLREMGVSYVDISGSGGTNWAQIEGYRNPQYRDSAFEFSDWGIPLALALLSTIPHSGIIASGGVRTGMDVAKCLVMGAEIVGMALPFIRTVVSMGKEGVLQFIERINQALIAVMLATASQSISKLQHAAYWIDPDLKQMLHEYTHAIK